jgi:hypothetical protein
MEPPVKTRLPAAVWLAAMALAMPVPLRAGVRELETADLRLLYRDVVHSPMAPYTGRCFENSMQFYRRLFGYVPAERVTVLLDDGYDFNNASAFATPRNTLLLHIAPANMIYETLPGNERINHTLNHELGHITALDQTAGSDRCFRRLFQGKVAPAAEHPETVVYQYLTQPRFAAPRWFHEGIAVFLETWMAGGIGRAQGAYDEMVFRSMVRDGSHFYDPLGLESEGTKIDFQAGANSYLYGARFMTYQAYAHGPEAFVRWASRKDGSHGYYATQFAAVYGQTVDNAWREWIAWEHGFQQANLDSLRRHPLTPYRDISPHALGSVSRAFFDPGGERLFAGVRTTGQFGTLAAISLCDGTVRTLCDVKGAALYYVTSLAYDPASHTLFYTADNNDWRDLCAVDTETGHSRRLIRDGRIGDLVFDPHDQCVWGMRHFNGISTLVRIPPPYREWNQVHSWPYGQDPYDIDISPDGRWLCFALAEISGRQSLQLLDLAALEGGQGTSRELFDFGATVPGSFVFDRGGRFLYGSTYYTGVSNIWRYDLAADSMQAVSNSETGFFRPLPAGGDSLVVFRYTGAGFLPAWVHAQPLQDLSAITFLGQQVAAKYPQLEAWNAGSPARIPLDSLATTGPYRASRHLGLESVVPVVEGYKDYAAAGLAAVCSDPGFWNRLDASVSYSPSGDLPAAERWHVNVGLQHLAWQLRYKLNGADFYDLFGPTQTSRKGSALGLRYERLLVRDRPRTLELRLAITGYAGLERLPYAQNVMATASELLAPRAELEFRNLRRTLGAVDDEKGLSWSLLYANNTTRKVAFNGIQGALAAGTLLPLRHSSLWVRAAAGYSPGDRADPFANFYFGGFGNNYVDRQNEKRYRDAESFPGVDLDEIAGTNFTKLVLEWNLPPVVFRRVGWPALYATWLRPAVFGTALAADLDAGADRTTVVDAGLQVDCRFTLLSRLSMTLSAGWAAAFEESRSRREEWMVSLKVL